MVQNERSERQLSWKSVGLRAVWFTLLVGGFSALVAYSYTPGDVARPPAWRAIAADVDDDGADYLLIMAVHPKCPCTRASVGELSRIIAKCGPSLSCMLLAFQPDGESDEWLDTGLIDSARELPYTTVVTDNNGALAQRMGMRTSGSVVLYNSRRTPVYYGGITSSRDHHGDNLGAAAVVSLVRTGATDRRTSPVFGCPIERPISSAAANACHEADCEIN